MTKDYKFDYYWSLGCAKAWLYISYFNEYALSSTHQYTSEWLLLYLGNIMLLSYVTVDFYLFYDGAADMQICDKTLHKILV